MLETRKILITGATGGLGLALIEAAVSKGFSVVGTGRSLENKSRIVSHGAEFIQFDLCKDDDLSSLVSGCDTIIHAAALSASWGDKKDFEAINVDATKKLLKAAQAGQCKKFIFISSPSIFADFQDRIGLTNASSPRVPPLNEYAKTKLAAELMVLQSDRKDFRCTAIRPRAIIGSDDKVLLPKLMELAKRSRFPIFRGGEALIEFTDVRDVAAAVMATIDNMENVAGQAINISGGSPVKVKDVVSSLTSAIGRQPKVKNIPMFIAKILAISSEALFKLLKLRSEPLLTQYTLATMAYSQTFDMRATQQKIGYQPQYDGFNTMLDLARKQGL